LWPRLSSLRDRLLNIHLTKQELARLDKLQVSKTATFNHIAAMYPNSTVSLQKKFSIHTLEQNGGNTTLLLFSDNRGKDRLRVRRAAEKSEKNGFQFKTLREKLNSASKRRKQIQFGTAEQAQSTIDIVKSQPNQSLATQREISKSPLKTYNSSLKVAQDSSALLRHLKDQVKTNLPLIV